MKHYSNFYLPTKYFNEVCRVCLSKHKVLIAIEEINFNHNLKPSGSVESITLKSVFQKFCNVEVDASDNKPQKICEFCLNMACKAFNFFQLFLYSNSFLDKKLEKESEEKSQTEEDKNNTWVQTDCTPSSFTPSNDNRPKTNLASSISEDAGDNEVIASDNADCEPTISSAARQKFRALSRQGKKRKRRNISIPQKWLEPSGGIDPIKEGALKILYKVKNKTQPPVTTRLPRQSTIKQIENQNEIFKCRFCRITFHDINDVIKHLKDRHADTNSCILCPTKFSRTSSRMFHLAAHSPKGLVCRPCRLYYESKDDLDYHRQNVDHANTKKCPQCDKTFKRPYEVRYHIDTVHLKKDKFQCNICGKMFRYGENLKRHEKSVHGARRYLCQVCGKKMTTNYFLKVHMQRVHKINQGVAPKKYPINRDPSKPRRPAVMNYKFECKFCPMKFFNFYAYFKHSEAHPEFKEYSCEVCSQIFETRNEYLAHRSIHEKYKCPFPTCNKMFVSKEAALRHKYPHARAFSCKLCDRTFRIKYSLDCHMNVHTGDRPYTCEKCGQGFKQQSHLKVHINALHDGKKRWQCQLCDKAFSYTYNLKAHMRSHRGEKPFSCPFCEKNFRDTVSRHKHVKKDHPENIEEFLVYKEQYQEEEILRSNLESEITDNISADAKSDSDPNNE